jgi:hypothetical protein
MTAEFVRDAAATAAIFGFFASAWFGWAQDQPPQAWRKALLAGSITSVLTAVAGGILTWRHWSDGTVFGPDSSRTFGVIVGIEFVVAAAGAALLVARRRQALIPAWIALVVGVHFFPLAPLLHYPLLYPIAGLVTLAALGAIPLARTRSVAVSATTGLLVGPVLLAAALFSLVDVLLRG